MQKAESILFLDDSEELLDLAKFFIEQECGRTSIVVRSLQEVKAHLPAILGCKLAILDINLGPNQPNGIDVYRWLRTNGFNSPIFFLTGHARTHPLVAEAERLGDAKVLTKLLPADEFRRIVRGEA